MHTDTEFGYKCQFTSLGVSVTWPKTTATQKGNTVPTTCQPKPRTWCARKPCRVVYEHGCQGSEGAAGCLVRRDAKDCLYWSQTAQQQPVQESQNGWGWKAPLELTWPNLPAQAEPTTKADCLGPCPHNSWLSEHMETPQALQATCASAPSPWH